MPRILVPSSAKGITTQILEIVKLNGRTDLILRGYVYNMIRPSIDLPFQSWQLKHKNKV